MSKVERADKPEENGTSLRRGWTTGACATAATKAAITALLSGQFPDPVSITLPKGETPAFSLTKEQIGDGMATAGIVKDAGDDPDVTHGATIIAKVQRNAPGGGITFHAGEGVGMVAKAGLPLGMGEPAINPVPRAMMRQAVEEVCAAHQVSPDFSITISVPGGEEMARHTWNPRLGILGGISILGTTGIVHPFSCSAWIHSIHRGVDVCRANGIAHALAATGSTSEEAARAFHDFPEEALLDMGDFAGGLLKYLRANPIPRITLAGGFAKFAKLAKGAMDLHSGRSQVDMDWLAAIAGQAGLSLEEADRIRTANTAMEALEIAKGKADLPGMIASLAREQAISILRGAPVQVEVMVFSRTGQLLGRAGNIGHADA